MDHILVILNRTETARSLLAVAGLLLGKFPGSHLDLLHPRPDIDPDYMPTEEMMSEARHQAFETERDTLYQQLEQAVTGSSSQAKRRVLRQVRGSVRSAVAAEAARAQLVLAGVAPRRGYSEAKDTIEAVLFDAGSPLLLVPETIPNRIGHNIAVAWEGSQAADEAIKAAMPFLLGADLVVILVAADRHASADLPGGMVDALAQQGRSAEVRRFELGGREIGDAILAEAGAAGADLLVMGAFTRLRTLEALFGGATREILAGTDIPLLLHH